TVTFPTRFVHGLGIALVDHLFPPKRRVPVEILPHDLPDVAPGDEPLDRHETIGPSVFVHRTAGPEAYRYQLPGRVPPPRIGNGISQFRMSRLALIRAIEGKTRLYA